MKKNLILPAIALLVIVGGAIFWQTSSSDSPQNATQSTVPNVDNKALVTTAAMKAEEAKFRTYVGDDYDRYYIANMIGHHQSAVDMANIALTNAKHPELKTLANAIISSQSEEITTMLAWQSDWGYPPSTGDNMVDHSAMNMMEDMAMMNEDLKKLSGDEFDKAFLQMMIAHHESAIAMSRPASDNAKHQELKTLATTVMADQTKEVLQMRNWHQEWGYGIVPAESAGSTSSGAVHDMSKM